MTQPTPPPDLLDELDQEALAYELSAEETVTTVFVAAVAAAVASIVAAYAALAAVGPLSGGAVASLRAFVASTLSAITPDMEPQLRREVVEGVRMGVRHSLRITEEQGLTDPESDSFDDPELIRVVTGVDDNAARILGEAVRLADALDLADEDAVMLVAAKATQASTKAKADTRWSANRAINEGADQVARANGLNLLWMGERDACLKCLAYFGLVVAPGQVFPAGLTFGTKPHSLGAIPYPPLHPWCRCRVIPYPGLGAVPFGGDLASGAAREARRTVARGWTGFDSMPERLRATDALIRRGAFLPKTVVARAARDVKRGTFSQRHKPRTNLSA